MAQIEIDLGRERIGREGEGTGSWGWDAFPGRRRSARSRGRLVRRGDAALLATTGWDDLGQGFRATPLQLR